MNSGPTPRPALRDWLLLARPWSVTAPLVPFLVGLGYVLGRGGPEPGGLLRWALALASGVLLVLACNLFNTWGDERSGVDRVPGAFLTTPQIQAGLFTLRQTFVYGLVLFLLAGLLGLPTLFYAVDGAWRFNTPLLAASLVGFWGAVNYSTLLKYKYLGLGVPMVALLEGFLYVFVVLALLRPQGVGLLCDAALGAPCACARPLGRFLALAWPVAALVGVILHGNDMRDIATDRISGSRSLASALGPRGALALFIALHLSAYAVPLALFLRGSGRAVSLLPCVALPLTLRLVVSAVRDYRAGPSAPAWRNLEQGSGAVHFLFGVLYACSLAF